jgi:hypothetical protein
MKNHKIFAATACMCLALIGTVEAAGSVTARVTHVRVDRDGLGMILFDQNVVGTPASCRVSAYVTALAFNSNTAGGKALLAAALTAKAMGEPVIAYGTGTCTVYGNWVEDVDYAVFD